MAWVSKGWYVSFIIRDKSNVATTMRIQLAEGAYADAVADAAIVRGYVEAATDGTLHKMFVEELILNDAWALPAEDCDVGVKASMTFQLAGGTGKAANFSIPAPSIGIFMGASGKNRNIVDGEDAAIVNLVDMFDASGGEAYISDGESTLSAPDGFVAGRRTGRKFSKA